MARLAQGDREALTPLVERHYTRLYRIALGYLRQRAVVVLRHYQELSLAEIASTLGMSLGTVKSSLHRALHRMRATLAGGES